MQNRLDAAGRWIAIAVASASALLVYAVTAVPFIVGADNAEFVTLSVALGTAHPPGYPLYTAYLRAMSWLPVGSAPHVAAIATALLGAATVGVLADALRNWGFSATAAVAAALVFAFDTEVWMLATHAEVFTLNNLIAAGILWAAGPAAPRSGIARAATLGLLAGFGLSNHHTIVMLAPIGLFGLWIAVRESERRLVPIVVAIGCGLVGLLPYAYLIGSATECVECLQWNDPSSLSELWRIFTRAEYGTTSLGARGERLPVESLTAFLGHLVRGTSGVVVLASLGGLALWIRRALRADWEVGDRAGLAALLATFLLAGPAFTMLFNIAPTGIGGEIVARFYALPTLTLTPFVAAAIMWRPRLLGVGAVIVTLAMSSLTVVGFHTSAIEDYTHDLLQPLPENAILIGTGDHRMFGVHYQQQVKGHRKDVVYIDASILVHDWYEQRVERRLGLELPDSDESIPIDEILVKLLRSGRSVFVTHVFVESLRAHPSYPYGVAIKLNAGEAPPSPKQLAAMNSEIYESFTMRVTPAEARSAWDREVFEHYQRTWTTLGRAFRSIGDPQGAALADAFSLMFRVDSEGEPPGDQEGAATIGEPSR